VAAALAREESRGAHFRTDFSQPSTAFQHSLIYTQKYTQKAGVRKIDAHQVAVPC
jgi:L-aspartate oxidase